MTVVRIIRTQHSVGQGCFFSEVHDWGGSRFHFVYDCGSGNGDFPTPETAAAANRFHSEARGSDPSLSALAISHFHADHINGLAALDMAQFGRAYLPYLTDHERDVIMIQAVLAAPAAAPLIRAAVYAPGALFGPASVVFVAPGNEFQRAAERVPRPPDGDWVGRDSLPAGYPNRTPSRRAAVVSDGDLIPLMPQGSQPRPLWVLKFYCRKDAEKLKALSERLAALGYLPSMVADLGALSRWIEGRRQDIRKAYDKALGPRSGGHNLVSMCCYSGQPEGRGELALRTEIREGVAQQPFIMPYGGPFFGHVEPGWVGCGDISLRREWDGFERHFSGLLNRTGFVTAPHHGSLHDHDVRLYASPAKAACFSFGLKNKHHHPSMLAVEEATSAGSTPFLVTEAPHSRCVQHLFG